MVCVFGCGDSSSEEAEPCGPGGTCPQGLICHASDQLCHSAGISDFITQVGSMTSGATATAEVGDPPAAGAGPTVTVASPDVVINGGTVRVTLEGSTSFDRIVVAVEGLPGHYLVSVPVPVSSLELLLTLAQDLGPRTFTLSYAVGSGGAIGAYVDVPATLVAVGTGDVQVSVSWDAESDVDLHVIDPTGDEVYYGRQLVTSGGSLDLDSNAGCAIDGVKNENITWESAPRGSYMVRLDYFDSCEMSATSYVVTVRVKDQIPRTFTGTFTGAGDGGGEGSGIDITTFEVP
jgi:hypothetical protein